MANVYDVASKKVSSKVLVCVTINGFLRKQQWTQEARKADFIAATKAWSWFGVSPVASGTRSQPKAALHNQQLRNTNQSCSLLMQT